MLKKIVTTSEDMTADWFTAALDDAGVLDGAHVTSVDIETVTGGVIARMIRASLTYDRSTTAPQTVVVKYPSDDAGSRGLALATGMYELETRFYQDIAPLLPDMSIPRSYAAGLEEQSGLFTLVLEDLGGRTKPGDVLTACSTDDCSVVLGELVNFQAPLWNSATIRELDWIADPRRTEGVFDSLAAGLQPFLDRFGETLDPAHVALFETVLPQAGDWARSWTAPTVVQHGDFRADNILFATTPDTAPVTVIDFQTVRLGPPGVDAAYFLASALSTEGRRQEERDLVAEYHGRLVAAGVEDFDFESCWTSYRAGSLYGVILFVGMGSQVESTPRGDQLIVDQVKRYADMALDLEAATAAGLS